MDTNLFNPSLDVSSFDLPVNSYDIFLNHNKTALEIGFGEGEFIVEMAQNNSDWNYIGIEIKYYRYKKALKQALQLENNNLKLLHFDINIAVKNLFENGIFDRVYINFPDPWPKDRHKKHRIINERFLNSLNLLMKENSTLEFASDHLEYVSHTIDQFQTSPYFLNIHKNKFTTKITGRPVTKFEKQFIEDKKTIYYLTFKKVN